MNRYRNSPSCGFSLVELLVSALIGMIAIAAITQSYLASESTKRSLSSSGGSVVAGTLALYMLERETRSAGFGLSRAPALGCKVQAAFAGDLSNPLPTSGSPFTPPLFPFTLAPVAIHPGAVTDQMTVLYAGSNAAGLPVKLTAPVPAPLSATVKVSTSYYFNDQELAILDNGAGGCSLFQVASRAPTGNDLNIDVGAPWNGSAFPAGGFPIGGYVYSMGSMSLKRFFVNSSDATLRMSEVSNALDAVNQSTETTVLARDVVGFKAQYGYSSSPLTTVVPANGWSTTAPVTALDWQRVVAVRLAIVMRPPQVVDKFNAATGKCDLNQTAVAYDASSPGWAGGSLPIVDSTNDSTCYRYQIYETTIPIRNRIWSLV